jgi:hypothetical protein
MDADLIVFDVGPVMPIVKTILPNFDPVEIVRHDKLKRMSVQMAADPRQSAALLISRFRSHPSRHPVVDIFLNSVQNRYFRLGNFRAVRAPDWFLLVSEAAGSISRPCFPEQAPPIEFEHSGELCAHTHVLGVGRVRAWTNSFLGAGLFQPINFAIAATFGREVRRLRRFRHNRRNSRGSASHRV